MTKNSGARAHSRAAHLFEPYLLLPAFAVVLTAVVWFAAHRLVEVEAEGAERAIVASANEVVETYEAHLIRNLGAIEQTLKTIQLVSQRETSHTAVLERLNEAGLLPSRVIFSVSLTDGNGNTSDLVKQRNEEDHTAPWGAPAAARGKVYLSRRTNISIYQEGNALRFSYPLTGAKGEPRGFAIVSVDHSYFTSAYDPARLGDRGVLALVADDGVFLAKRMGESLSSGANIGIPAEKLDEIGENGPALLASPWDGEDRYFSARNLFKFPFYVVVGLSRSEQLTALARTRQVYFSAAGVLSLLLFAVALLLARSSWQLQQSRARARKEHETYYAASEASLDAVLVLKVTCDKFRQPIDFVVESANRRTEELFGKSKAELINLHLGQLVPGYLEMGLLDELLHVHETGEIAETEWPNEMRGISAGWLYRQVVRIEGGIVLILRDITERKQSEARIIHMAQHDALTGLPNRTLLDERVQQAMLQAKRNNRNAIIGFMDLDHFKQVNDTLGHKAGDVVLKAVAERVVQCLRKTDSVIRIGGDEFVLIFADQMQDSGGIVTTLRRISAAISEPIAIEDKRAEVTPSIGLAIYPNDGDDCNTLLMRADAALYRAKELGRNNFQFFTEELNTSILEKWSLQERLRGALKRKEFSLVYQPLVDVQTNKIFGLEALIRWNHPEKGVILPTDFIPLAEETNAILPIGAWVLQTACRQARDLQEAGFEPMIMSVNISARQFLDDVLIDQVKTALDMSSLAPEYLELELTESMMLHDLDKSIVIMKHLQALGVKFSIDDFGTGYSSLSLLKGFPINRLKIDRSFIKDLPGRADDKAIAKAVTSLGHELGLKVLAEGVETLEQYNYLKSNDCDEIQGYYFSHPLSREDLKILLAGQVSQL